MENFCEDIKEVFLKKNFVLDENQRERFFEYFKLLTFWNEKINLTAIVEKKDVLEKHFLDSVIAQDLFEKNAKVIDLGSGAGFPGIPLKIVRSDLKITLVDSVNKKVNFLNEVISTLGLKDINAVHTRIEDFANKNGVRENFDYVVSRAVSRLNVLCEYALPFLKVGGRLVAYKSVDADEEIFEAQNALKILGGVVENVVDVSFENLKRKLIVIRKIQKTDKKYPRGANKPRLSPII